MSVFPGDEFNFKIVAKKGIDYSRYLDKDSVVIKTDDGAGGDKDTLYVKINYNRTSIKTINNQVNTSPVFINIQPGAISFSVKNAGSISASLFSLTGKKVANLTDNQSVVENTTYTFLTNKYNLSKGLYLLKCRIKSLDGVIRMKRKIAIIK